MTIFWCVWCTRSHIWLSPTEKQTSERWCDKLESDRIRVLIASVYWINPRLWPLSTWLAATQFLHSTPDYRHCMTGCTVLLNNRHKQEHIWIWGVYFCLSHGSGIDYFIWTTQHPISPVQVQTWWRSPKISDCEEEVLQRLVPSRVGLCEEQAAHQEDDNGQKN